MCQKYEMNDRKTPDEEISRKISTFLKRKTRAHNENVVCLVNIDYMLTYGFVNPILSMCAVLYNARLLVDDKHSTTIILSIRGDLFER